MQGNLEKERITYKHEIEDEIENRHNLNQNRHG